MADTKLTGLTATTSPATTDIVYIVTTPGGTPASKKVTVSDIPLGFGAMTDYSATSTIVGWSSFTTKEIIYQRIGKIIFVSYRLIGTSNSATTSFTLPTNAVSTLPAYQDFHGRCQDNGGAAVMAIGELTAGSNVVALYKDLAAGAFTATGSKSAFGQFFYFTA